MSKSRFQFVIPAAYFLFSMSTFVSSKELPLPSATNGTIGPKSGIDALLETSINDYPMPTDLPLGKLVTSDSASELPLTSKLRIETPLENSLKSKIDSLLYKERLTQNNDRSNQKPSLTTSNKVIASPRADLDGNRNTSINPSRVNPLEKESKDMALKVNPGLIRWNADLKEACKASARSGKPVLLVHILGNLNDHFC